MNDLVRFAMSVEYATGKKRGRRPVFSSNKFYPYKEELQLQQATGKELERFIEEAYGVAISGEAFAFSDDLNALSNLSEDLPDSFKSEVSAIGRAIGQNVSNVIANSSEMIVGKPYYPPAAKDEIFKTWEANFQMLCKSAESDIKKDISRIVAQAKNEGWNGKQVEKAVKKELPEKYKNRAELISRTEAAKLNTQATISTYKQIGCQYYKWMSTLDERVRLTHENMNDKICSIENPDVYYEETPDGLVEHERGDDMVHLHPGEDFQCRCTMVMWDPAIDGKYDVKEKPEEEKTEEPEQRTENDPASRELEKANERLAEQEKELERAKNEAKTAENELANEKSARKAAEKAQKEAENLVKKEAEKSISVASKVVQSAKRYEGVTNDPGLKKCVSEVEDAVKETKKSGIASKLYERLEALKERIFGIQSEEEVMEAIGVKRFETKKTPMQVIDGANPTKNKKNCFITSALFEVRCRGWDAKAKPYDDSMIVLSNEPQLLFKNAQKVKFTSLENLKALLEEYEDGARFSINAEFIVDGAFKGHSFNAYIENGKVRFVCLQEDKKDASVFFRKYTLVEEDNFFFRTDGLKLNYKNLKKVIK